MLSLCMRLLRNSFFLNLAKWFCLQILSLWVVEREKKEV